MSPGRALAMGLALWIHAGSSSRATQHSSSDAAEQARALVHRLSIASPYKIPPAALRGRIRYRFAMPDGLAWQFPVTGEQRVAVERNIATVDICRDCGSEPAPDALALERATAFNAYVDHAHQIRSMARPHANDPHRAMVALVSAVRARMDGPVSFVSYDSATQAYARRSGDCTEFAVLLASAARSRGIPARVVYGWVYSSRFSGLKHHFSPHMWVQAWTGERWASYDAGMGGFGAGHIVLGVGQGLPGDYRRAVEAQGRLRLLEMAGIAPATPQP